MDFLKAQIGDLKRKSESPADEAPQKKYLRRGDIERLKLEEEAKEREKKERDRIAEIAAKKVLEEQAKERRAANAKKSLLIPQAANSKSPSGTPDPGDDLSSSTSAAPIEAFNISPADCTRRLRAKGQPIRLFGENDKDRRLRLRALELMENSEKNAMGGNDFKKALEDMESGQKEATAKSGGHKGKEVAIDEEKEALKKESQQILDLGLLKSDPDKLYPLIYYALKRTLGEWADSLAERPESIRQSQAGIRAAAVQVQSTEYLKPLFLLLRRRQLPPDVLGRLSEIVHHMQSREYQKANDCYLRLSIGTAAWPIGVTMVGIHERSAREKISSDSVAHVLNDEVSRKYIQSVKRLMTFHQTKYPPDDVSKLFG